MERITQRTIAFAVTLMLAAASFAMSAPKSERFGKPFTLEGQVISIDREARTMVVSDLWSKKLYLVNVPKSETFKVTFGMNMQAAESELWQTHQNDRVRLSCKRTQEHLARLADGRTLVVLTVSR